MKSRKKGPRLPLLVVRGAPRALLAPQGRRALERRLKPFLTSRRWFGAKARTVERVRIVESVAGATGGPFWTLLEVKYRPRGSDLYFLPLLILDGLPRETDAEAAAVCRVKLEGGGVGFLLDALHVKSFARDLLDLILRERRFGGAGAGRGGMIAGALRRGSPQAKGCSLEPAVGNAEQTNTSIRYGKRFILKLYRHLEPGIQPDLEMTRFLTLRGFPRVPPLVGHIQYQAMGSAGARERRSVTLGILQGYVPHRGDGWEYTLEELGRYLERASRFHPAEPAPRRPLMELARGAIPRDAVERIGAYIGSARILARRTAELHEALASERRDRDFAPEPFTPRLQRSLHAGLSGGARRAIDLLRKNLRELPPDIRESAHEVLRRRGDLPRAFDGILDRPLTSSRIRCHGDYHLGQVLHTGKDFFIIDFEGETARPLAERRRKDSPLRDVAGMLRSFDYAMHVGISELTGGARTRAEPWARYWRDWVSAAFLKAYLRFARKGVLRSVPGEEVRLLLEARLLEKALYELEYELNTRPEWVGIPLGGILGLLDAQAMP